MYGGSCIGVLPKKEKRYKKNTSTKLYRQSHVGQEVLFAKSYGLFSFALVIKTSCQIPKLIPDQQQIQKGMMQFGAQGIAVLVSTRQTPQRREPVRSILFIPSSLSDFSATLRLGATPVPLFDAARPLDAGQPPLLFLRPRPALFVVQLPSGWQ